jgi:hypothetical protein
MEEGNKNTKFGAEGSDAVASAAAGEGTGQGEAPVVSGIDLFLKDYDLDQAITIEDEEKKFDELSSEEQYGVLKSLAELGKEDLVQLDDKEKETIDYLRKNETTLDDVVKEATEKEAEKASSHYELQSENFKDMPDDIVYLKHLKDKFPKSSDEEIKGKLETAKDVDGFENLVKDLRDVFESKQDIEVSKAKKVLYEEDLSKIKDEQKLVVDAVIPIDYISDWKISDEEKNDILGDIIEVNDNLISKFQKEITSSPEKLFEAAYKYKYMDAKTAQLESFYKQELKKAYLKGKEESLKGTEIDKDKTNFAVNEKLKTEGDTTVKQKTFGED